MNRSREVEDGGIWGIGSELSDRHVISDMIGWVLLDYSLCNQHRKLRIEVCAQATVCGLSIESEH